MEHPIVVDGGDSFQMWGVPASAVEEVHCIKNS
jgi:hypothetical protein